MAADVEDLADWSAWLPLAQGAVEAPRLPGVYMMRGQHDGPIVYIGMAGERRGQGIRGRLAVYMSGKAAVSGLGEAAFNRALAEPDWVRARLEELESGSPGTAKQWARAAVDHWDLHARWAVTADRASARVLERQVLAALHAESLWNVRRSAPGSVVDDAGC